MSYVISHGSHGGSLRPESSPGLRTLVVPRLAARGMALPEIASVTHVPLALVELIAGELIAGEPTSNQAQDAFRAHSAPPAVPGLVHVRRRFPQRKHLVRLATCIFLAAALLASVLLRAPFLPIAVMVAGGWLGRQSP